MSGHSKWATIKRKKGAIDAARGRLFTRLIKEITIAARNGSDPAGNPRLRLAVETARKNSMPMDNIKRAIQRGAGELEGSALEEIMYEGYGPGGIAVLIETVTDNRNRTVSEIRHLLSRNGGSMAEAGAVSWNFNRMGVVTIPRPGVNEDDLMMASLDAGAEDVKSDEENFEVYCPLDAFESVRKSLEEKKYAIASAAVQYVPKTLVKVEHPHAEAVLKFMEAIEEHDDVQNVFSNFDIDEKLIAQYGNS